MLHRHIRLWRTEAATTTGEDTTDAPDLTATAVSREASQLGRLTSQPQLSERPTGPGRPRSESPSDREAEAARVKNARPGALVERPVYLVKADQVELSAHVDPLGADAEDADALQPPLRVHDARRHGRR